MINLPPLDQNRKEEQNAYGESVRLSNELRTKPAYVTYGIRNEEIIHPQVNGFNCETADYSQFVTWLNDNTKSKSRSLFWFVIRIMAIRFPEKHHEIRASLAQKHQLEWDLILSQMKNEMEWIGLCSYQNQVELDINSPLNYKNIKVVKGKNDTYSTKRI